MSAGGSDPRGYPRPTADYPGGGYGQGPAPHAPTGAGGTGRVVAIVAGTLAVVAVIAVAVYFLAVAPRGGKAQDEYRGKVNAEMEKVVSANRGLSAALGALRTRESPTAQRSVEQAQSATSTARGAVSAFTVPQGSEQLATNARQTLGREASYLTAVKGALGDPQSGAADQAQTLAGNLTDALDVVAPPASDWSQSVSGADNLAAWARRNVRVARRPSSMTPSAGSTTGPATPGTPSGSDCGGGLRAGPNTSCAFAHNVQNAYNDAPGNAATVEVYSPATGQTYTMDCRPAGNGITCSGGNNASVSF